MTTDKRHGTKHLPAINISQPLANKEQERVILPIYPQILPNRAAKVGKKCVKRSCSHDGTPCSE